MGRGRQENGWRLGQTAAAGERGVRRKKWFCNEKEMELRGRCSERTDKDQRGGLHDERGSQANVSSSDNAGILESICC